jgi:hypothetical protein
MDAEGRGQFFAIYKMNYIKKRNEKSVNIKELIPYILICL